MFLADGSLCGLCLGGRMGGNQYKHTVYSFYIYSIHYTIVVYTLLVSTLREKDSINMRKESGGEGGGKHCACVYSTKIKQANRHSEYPTYCTYCKDVWRLNKKERELVCTEARSGVADPDNWIFGSG